MLADFFTASKRDTACSPVQAPLKGAAQLGDRGKNFRSPEGRAGGIGSRQPSLRESINIFMPNPELRCPFQGRLHGATRWLLPSGVLQQAWLALL